MPAEPIDMPAHQFGGLLRRTAAALCELVGTDQCADVETDARLPGANASRGSIAVLSGLASIDKP